MKALIAQVIKYYTQNPNQLTLHIVLGLLVIYLLYIYQKLQNRIIESKDQEIERLADDNRRYREIYLKDCKGVSTKDLGNITPPKGMNRRRKKK